MMNNYAVGCINMSLSYGHACQCQGEIAPCINFRWPEKIPVEAERPQEKMRIWPRHLVDYFAASKPLPPRRPHEPQTHTDGGIDCGVPGHLRPHAAGHRRGRDGGAVPHEESRRDHSRRL